MQKLLGGDQAINQFKNYLKQGDFEYIFDRQKLLRDVADTDGFVEREFQKIFRSNNYEIFEDFYDNSNLRILLFEEKITKRQALQQFKSLVDELDESIFKLIKVE